jgi:hypothetical protein
VFKFDTPHPFIYDSWAEKNIQFSQKKRMFFYEAPKMGENRKNDKKIDRF